jgi:hypothetical protein
MPSVSLAETRGEAIGDAAADGHLTESLRAAPGPCGPPSQAQQNQNPAQQNQSPVQQNPNPSQRDPNRSSFHDSRLLNRLAPISARVGSMTFAQTVRSVRNAGPSRQQSVFQNFTIILHLWQENV